MPETRVVVEEIEPEARQIVVEGRTLLQGQRLSYWLEEVDGYEGVVMQPTTGRSFPVSLERWRGRDPDTTWLRVSFETDL